MRLTCPGCAAIYEVPDDAIPDEGRDVQCTNCGHGWFQIPRVGADPAAAPLPGPMGEAEDPAAGDGLDDPFGEDAPEGAPAGPRRSAVDPRTRRVLREEAEREVEARRVERRRLRAIDDGPGGGGPPDPARRGARPREGVRADRIDPPSAHEAGLSPAPWDEEAADARRGRGAGFALGFVGALAVAAVLVAGYLYAGAVSEAVPALAAPMASYVDAVSEARLAVDTAARAAATRLDELLPDPAGGG